MGFYSNFLRSITEVDSSLLNYFPERLVKEVGISELRKGNNYLAEQIDKSHNLDFDLPLGDVEKRMYDSLLQLQADDFCWFFNRIRGKIKLDPERLNQGYIQLVRKGNVSNLEAIVNQTRIKPVIGTEDVLKGYDSLASQGRIDAMDYLRQLTGVPISFSEEATLASYQTLFISRKYSSFIKMRDLSKIEPQIDDELKKRRFYESLEELDYKSAWLIQQIAKVDFPFKEFDELVSQAVNEKKVTQIPFLLKMSGRGIKSLRSEVISEMFHSQDLNCFKFLYEQLEIKQEQQTFSESAYNLGISHQDVKLLANVCEKTKTMILPKDGKMVIEEALMSLDTSKIRIILDHLKIIPPISPLVLNSFLHELQERDESEFKEYFFEKTGFRYSPSIALFAHEVKKGNIEGIVSTYEQHEDIKTISEARDVYKIAKEMIKNE